MNIVRLKSVSILRNEFLNFEEFVNWCHKFPQFFPLIVNFSVPLVVYFASNFEIVSRN